MLRTWLALLLVVGAVARPSWAEDPAGLGAMMQVMLRSDPTDRCPAPTPVQAPTSRAIRVLARLAQGGARGREETKSKMAMMAHVLKRGYRHLGEVLAASGRLATTLVIVIGEFGRSPKLQGKDGRDHWAPCFTGLFAGAGVRGGQVVGRSDAQGAYPSTVPYSPDDVGATVYDALGVPADAEVRDRVNRPVALNRGQVIRALYTGA